MHKDEPYGLHFQDRGSWEGSRLVHLIQFANGHTLQATTVNTLRNKNELSKKVLVVRGKHLMRFFTFEDNIALRLFSESILGFNETLSKVAAYKDYLDKYPASEENHNYNFVGIPWRHGPIPALMVGQTDNLPVFSTPIPLTKGNMKSRSNKAKNDLIIMQSVSQHFTDCMESYFEQISDLLFSRFMNFGKGRVLETERVIHAILSTSIEPKLDFFRKVKANSCEMEIINNFRLVNQDQFALYATASNIIKVILSLLKYIGGEVSEVDFPISALSSSINDLPDYLLEKKALSEVVSILNRNFGESTISPLGQRESFLQPWIDELKSGCGFLSHAKALLDKFGREKIFIFFSHHMNVYASDDIYSQLNSHVKKQFPYDNTGIVVWSGDDRTSHILMSILARIWLSDVQLVYIPNSLVLRESGTPKILSPHDDWVIEELYYGSCLKIPLHLLIATDQKPEEEKIINKFLYQISSYDWESLNYPLKREGISIRGDDFKRSVQNHFRQKNKTIMTPSRFELSPQSRDMLRDGVFAPAILAKFSTLLTTFRYGIQSEDWVIVQSLYFASLKKGNYKRYLSVTRDEIMKEYIELTKLQQCDVKDDKIRNVLLRVAKKNIMIGGRSINLAEKGQKDTVTKKNTYRFLLHKLTEEVSASYKGMVSKEDFEPLFREILISK